MRKFLSLGIVMLMMAATIGVPLYACGGGTIPLLQQWLWDGMSLGSAASFMITGPATKITTLGALKIVLGVAALFALSAVCDGLCLCKRYGSKYCFKRIHIGLYIRRGVKK